MHERERAYFPVQRGHVYASDYSHLDLSFGAGKDGSSLLLSLTQCAG